MTDLPLLYHAHSAVCAAKVRLVLAEKSIGYVSRPLDFARNEHLTPEYRRLNPHGVVPTLVHRGQVITESTVINEYLDRAFSDHPLGPTDPAGRARLHAWTRREDAVHETVNTLSTVAVFRPDMLAATEQARRARIDGLSDLPRRHKLAELLRLGVASPIVALSLSRLARQLADMDAALAAAPFLLGEDFTLADAGLISFLYRLECLCLAPIWEERFVNVRHWFAACKARPSFAVAVRAPVPDGLLHKYRMAGERVAPELLGLFASTPD